MPIIHLRFEARVPEDEAWDIAEKLEKAAIARDYRSVSGWVEVDRTTVLGDEKNPPQSSAVHEERHGAEAAVTGIGDVEGGPVQLRRYGENQ